MFKIIEIFSFKATNLITHLIKTYSEPIFQLETIEVNGNNGIAIFYDNRACKIRTKSLKDLFNNKRLLRCFNGKDACGIGYAYGRLISKEESNEK